MNSQQNVLILGAAGRDFHNFNVVYRDDPRVRVVAFTATQIPGIEDRRYPEELAGSRYPGGIPIRPMEEMESLIRSERVHQVDFAYSDVRHIDVMHVASRVLAAGADFTILGPDSTMLTARVPVIAVSAVRTGCGKSPVARWLSRRLRAAGRRPAVLRHPMPYGDLRLEACQRFASLADLDLHRCTVEEREEYEPHLREGGLVFAGVEYARILGEAESECDLVLWDGGNNDFPFVRPDLHIVLVDPLRSGDETAYHPGETTLRMADVVLIAKCDHATEAQIAEVGAAARRANPQARILRGASPPVLDCPAMVRGKRALVIDDGPTLTHGGMAYGAGLLAAEAAGAREIVDPRPFAPPELARLYIQYPHLGKVLPAVGYDREQLGQLAEAVRAAAPDVVVLGTPADLAALVDFGVPSVRVTYDYQDLEQPGLAGELDRFLARVAG